jgi:hypothetical protein
MRPMVVAVERWTAQRRHRTGGGKPSRGGDQGYQYRDIR